jgi:hypothetical protein
MPTPRIQTQRLYDPSGNSALNGHDPHKGTDEALCAAIFAVLIEHYPGHFWQIIADAEQGIARIRIPILMGQTLGYTLHLDKITSPNDLKRAVILAGGEILERWRIPRGTFDLGAFLTARQDRRIISINDTIPH